MASSAQPHDLVPASGRPQEAWPQIRRAFSGVGTCRASGLSSTTAEERPDPRRLPRRRPQALHRHSSGNYSDTTSTPAWTHSAAARARPPFQPTSWSLAHLGAVGWHACSRGNMGAGRRVPRYPPLVSARGRAVPEGGERCYGGKTVPPSGSHQWLELITKEAGRTAQRPGRGHHGS